MKRLIGLLGFFFLFAERPVLAQPPESLHKIEHILIIFEENRSFDNLFGFFPGADGIPPDDKLIPQSDRDGKIYATLPQPIDGKLKPPGPDSRFPADLPNKPFLMNGYVKPAEKTGDLVHEFYREQLQINGGRMDKFVAYTNAAGLTMGYYDYKNSHLWKLAETYALGDRMFHSAFGGSYLNHTYLVCGCAFRWPDAPPAIVAQIDEKGRVIKDCQVTPDGYSVNTSRSVYLHAPGDTDVTRLVPPQTMPHIGNRLDEKNISWAWYSGGYDDAMAGKPDPLFQFHHQPLAYFRDLAPGSERQKKHLKDAKDLMQAIDANNLPQVAFYKPIGALNQHPGYANVTDADEHIHEIIEKLKKSPLWSSTLVIITYDENGGSWDHVAPPIRDKWGP